MNFKMSTLVTKPDFQGEFTASILAAAASPDIISFAGGLPNPVSFPIPEMEEATKKILAEKGAIALQYSSTPGYPALREWVAKRYETMGVYGVTADDIIITTSAIRQFEKGQSVRVIEGKFKGVEGKVARYQGQQRVAIIVEGAFTVATAYVPSAFLEKMSED